jgi:hypothetical protein
MLYASREIVEMGKRKTPTSEWHMLLPPEGVLSMHRFYLSL